MNETDEIKEVPVELKTKPTKHSKTPIVSDEEKEYGKLALVISAIFLASVFVFLVFDGKGPFESITPVQAFATQFMGVFFLVFAGFKFVNLKSFVHGFAMYDVIAKRSRLYSYLYPFLQLTIGIAMFVVPQYWMTHFAALLVSGVALVGVIISLLNKQKIQCACLGNVIKMPLATVSAIEDGSMFIIAGLMTLAMI